MTHPGLVALAMVAVVWTIQYLVGAFAAERGLHSDEAAHFMNGLVLRDYLREGLGQSPLDFAREYYRHYPKIAPFMWPPLFHGVLGLALLPGWPAGPVAICLVGSFTAWTAWRLYLITNTFASVPVSLGVVGFFLATPIVVNLSSSVMIDIAIAACCLEAAYWLGRFAESGSTRVAVVFGVMTACACVAKGNGLSAVIAPVALVLLTGRLDLLRRPGLYVAAVIVIVLAAPPLALAYYLDASLGDFGPVSLSLAWERLAFYSGHVWVQLGSAPVLFAAIGTAAVILKRPWLSTHARHQASALVSMVIGAFVFHLWNPHILSSGRYITLALAPILGLSALGVMAATAVVQRRRLRWSMQLLAFTAMALAHFGEGTDLRAQAPLGYRESMRWIQRQDSLAGKRLLVVSNEQGEGAGVVEVALLELTPRPMVLRGSKVLGTEDWMGNDRTLTHPTAAALLDDLEALHVDYVILDGSPASRALVYWPQTHEALTFDPSRVDAVHRLTPSPAGPLRPLDIYRLRRHAPGPPRELPFSGTSQMVGVGR
ncbi:MAG: hypothetical protein U0P30_09270 [Vicinamibacterales bacterium]